MRRRWSAGVVVAVAMAIAVAMGAFGGDRAGHRTASPVMFEVAQQGDGVALSVTFAGVVVTLEI